MQDRGDYLQFKELLNILESLQKPLRVLLDNKPALYVRLQLNETNYLHLDEVEVY